MMIRTRRSMIDNQVIIITETATTTNGKNGSPFFFQRRQRGMLYNYHLVVVFLLLQFASSGGFNTEAMAMENGSSSTTERILEEQAGTTTTKSNGDKIVSNSIDLSTSDSSSITRHRPGREILLDASQEEQHDSRRTTTTIDGDTTSGLLYKLKSSKEEEDLKEKEEEGKEGAVGFTRKNNVLRGATTMLRKQQDSGSEFHLETSHHETDKVDIVVVVEEEEENDDVVKIENKNNKYGDGGDGTKKRSASWLLRKVQNMEPRTGGTNSRPPPHWNRILQEPSMTTTNPRCSNISDSFRTSLVFSYQGNKTLLTDNQLVLLGDTFGNAYNALTTTMDSDSADSSICDPLFRTIATVEVSTNLSFTGAKDGDALANPLPITPVRHRHRRHHRQLEEETKNQNQASSWNSDWWKLQAHHLVHDVDARRLQQQQQQPPNEGEGNIVNNVTVNLPDARFDVGFILLTVIGNCRACEGNRPEFSLFDDISGRRRNLQEDNITDEDCTCPVNDDDDDPFNVRSLQQEQPVTATTAATSIVSAELFQTIFTENLQELQDNGDLTFLEEVNEVFEVAETQCPTKEEEFSTVHLVTGMIFDTNLLLSLGSRGVQRVEKLFRDSYNGIAQQLCDPIFRSISRAQFVSILDEEKENDNNGGDGGGDEDEGSSSVKLAAFEFVVDVTCRGEDCVNPGCIFDDNDTSDGCGSPSEQRQRRAKTVESASLGQQMKNKEDDTSSLPFLSHGSHPNDARWLINVGTDKREESNDRCLCRKGRSKRPPTLLEFKTAFQKGLDEITQDSKLRSCQACEFAFECQSDVCLEGQCAEKDTGLLRNDCECNLDSSCQNGFCRGATVLGNNETGVATMGVCSYKLEHCQECTSDSNCISGFCLGGRCGGIDGLLEVGCPCQIDASCGTLRCDVLDTGSCQPRLASCASCTTNTDCISNQCTGGVCGEAIDGKLQTGCDCQSNTQCQSNRCARDVTATGVAGQCVAKIVDTCTEPCLVSGDCETGTCGSIVCLPADNALLADGCLSTFGYECQSSRSDDNVCVPLVGLCGVCSINSDCITGQCTSGHCADSLGKLPNDCLCLADLDCASGRCADNICVPEELTENSNSPTVRPTGLPTSSPSALSIGGATPSPSTLPTRGPTPSPSTSSIGGATPSPITLPTSRGPTPSPSTGPTPSPSGRPSTSPTLLTSGPSGRPSTSPTFSPSNPPSTVPTRGPTISPTATPSAGPTSSPIMSPSASPTEKNECDFDPCGPGTCVDLVGGFACTCEDGYEFDDNEQTCVDINECDFDPCGTGICLNEVGSFTCACEEGYEFDDDLQTCVDIDECDADPCDINADCINYDGSFDCTCHDNFTGDGFECDPNDCFVSTGLIDDDALFAFCDAHADGFKCCQDSSGIVGFGACSKFEGEQALEGGEICKGSCVGDNACTNIRNTGRIIIESGSCIGLAACHDTGTPLTILEGSCLGDGACLKLGLSATDGISIGTGACTTDAACFALGENADDVFIGDLSCTGTEDCYELGNDAASVTVGTQSCFSGVRNCYQLGQLTSAESIIIIGDYSCQFNGCRFLGQETNGDITIGDYCCQGNSACWRIGMSASASITLGYEACSFGSACLNLGINSPGAVFVDDFACNDFRSCEQVGTRAAYVTIGDSACNGVEWCLDCENITGNADPVEIEPDAVTCPY